MIATPASGSDLSHYSGITAQCLTETVSTCFMGLKFEAQL